jgi:hypothetical protein
LNEEEQTFRILTDFEKAGQPTINFYLFWNLLDAKPRPCKNGEKALVVCAHLIAIKLTLLQQRV